MKQKFAPCSDDTEKNLKEIINNKFVINELKSNLPNEGILKYPKIVSGEIVYGVKLSLLDPWCSGQVVSVISDHRFLVKFDFKEEKLLEKNEIALFTQNPVRFPVGSRVIAKYNAPKVKSKYYSGIVAEPPKLQNQYRYMIFYDNGNAQYQYHNDIRLIVQKTDKVWNYVHPDIKDFIKGYLEKYPERQTFNFTINQKIKVKLKKKYKSARVLDIDCSIVKICFSDKYTECLFRGSSRIKKISIKRKNPKKRNQIEQFGPAHLTQPFVGSSGVEEEPPSPIVKGGTARKSTNRRVIRFSSNRVVKRNKNSSTSSHIDMLSLSNPGNLNEPSVDSSKAQKELLCAVFKDDVARKITNSISTYRSGETIKCKNKCKTSSEITMSSLPTLASLNKPFAKCSNLEEVPPCTILKGGVACKRTNSSSTHRSVKIVKCDKNSSTLSQIDMLSLPDPTYLNKLYVECSNVEEELPCAIFKGGVARKKTNSSSSRLSDETIKCKNKYNNTSSEIAVSSLPTLAYLNKPFVKCSKVKENPSCAEFMDGVAPKSSKGSSTHCGDEHVKFNYNSNRSSQIDMSWLPAFANLNLNLDPTNKCSTHNSAETVNFDTNSSSTSKIDMLSLLKPVYLTKPFVKYSKVEEEPPSAVIGVVVASKRTNKSSKPPSDEIVKCYKNLITSSQIDMTSLPTLQPRRFVAHTCNHSCIEWTNYSYSKTKKISMLATPLYFGFTRSFEYIDSQKYVVYHTPCGRSIRDMKEMHGYIFVTGSDMTIDQFNFDSLVRPLVELKNNRDIVVLEDLSSGKEFRPIKCINNNNHELPPPIEYITIRQPMAGVDINVDSNFLCGCDCTDNCQDKSKCACWKMTIEAPKKLPNIYKDPVIGYNFRQLYEHVLTGIYECNKTCKCNSKCLNRVVQNPLSHNIQVFFTTKKGWGIRCINDIPKGSFVCNYVGQLFTETDANENGKLNGDEYLAELDYIEVVEKIKEDYESDVYFSDPKNKRLVNSESNNCHSSRSNAISNNKSKVPRCNKKPCTSWFCKHKKSALKTKINGKIPKKPEPHKSVREYFGNNESVYIMDGKISSNVGRYINHSCSPNLFVQNVFVDTHDLRFPWVSFFALHYIKAGTELTWDYNYIVGSVPGKVLECHCGSVNCRGRLL